MFTRTIKWDQKIMVFKDMSPAAKTHVLIVPKARKNLDMMQNAREEDIPILGYMLYKSSEIAKICNLVNGYRLVINNGEDAGDIIRTNSVSLAHSLNRRRKIAGH